jgi:hypothetical protein
MHQRSVSTHQLSTASSLPDVRKVASWSVNDVLDWAQKQGLDEEGRNILKAQKVKGSTLLKLTKIELLSVGIPLGPASTLASAIEQLHDLQSIRVNVTKERLEFIMSPSLDEIRLPPNPSDLFPSLSFAVSLLVQHASSPSRVQSSLTATMPFPASCAVMPSLGRRLMNSYKMASILCCTSNGSRAKRPTCTNCATCTTRSPTMRRCISTWRRHRLLVLMLIVAWL